MNNVDKFDTGQREHPVDECLEVPRIQSDLATGLVGVKAFRINEKIALLLDRLPRPVQRLLNLLVGARNPLASRLPEHFLDVQQFRQLAQNLIFKTSPEFLAHRRHVLHNLGDPGVHDVHDLRIHRLWSVQIEYDDVL